MTRKLCLTIVLTVLLFSSAQVARAAITTYADRTSFNAAASVVATLDFNGIAPAGGFVPFGYGGSFTLSGVTFSTNASTFLAIVDQGYGPACYSTGSGGGVATAQVGSPSVLTISLPPHVSAIGFDTNTFDSATVQITLSSGDVLSVGTIDCLSRFVGFTTDVEIASLSLITANVVVNIDDFAIGTAGCQVPDGENSTFFGWVPTNGDRTEGQFTATLVSATGISFTNRFVQESTPLPDINFSGDTCWNLADAVLPPDTPIPPSYITVLPGAPFAIGAQNDWIDTIGWNETQVQFYMRLLFLTGTPSCHTAIKQRMTMLCPGGSSQQYTTNYITDMILAPSDPSKPAQVVVGRCSEAAFNTSTGQCPPTNTMSAPWFLVATFGRTLNDISNSLQLGLINDVGIVNALSQKIQNADNASVQGQIHAARNMLEAFKSQVNAQSGKHISAKVAQLLLQDAESLLRQLPQ